MATQNRTVRKSMRRGISKASRAAYKAWETRIENEEFERRSKAAKKAARTRRRNARRGG